MSGGGGGGVVIYKPHVWVLIQATVARFSDAKLGRCQVR